MISTELHNKKPYALPVQCFPYDGLKENDLRRLITELIKEMVAHGMKVAGIATCILNINCIDLYLNTCRLCQ